MKSVYRSIWLNHRTSGEDAHFSRFLELCLGEYLQIPGTDIVHNHFKPQSYFVPPGVIEDERTILCTIEHLYAMPDALRAHGIAVDGNVPRINTSHLPDAAQFDMTDAEIQAELQKHFPLDFGLYQIARSSTLPHRLNPLGR